MPLVVTVLLAILDFFYFKKSIYFENLLGYNCENNALGGAVVVSIWKMSTNSLL